jgi:hypothetical protein
MPVALQSEKETELAGASSSTTEQTDKRIFGPLKTFGIMPRVLPDITGRMKVNMEVISNEKHN